MARGGFPGGGFGGGGLGNMNNLMKQAQKMQKDMEKAQQELENKIVEVSVGGGAITIVATAKKEIKEIVIKPEVVDRDDVEMLQDLILTGVNEALRKADEVAGAEMGKITGGLGGLPGLF